MSLTIEYFRFFKELEKNNNKDWFEENRKRYTKIVKDPFKDLTSDLINEIGKIEAEVGGLEPKNAIFRINRDIRFSNDKTPYKTYMAAIISPKGKKDKTDPGIYFEVNKSGINIFGGVYMPDKDQLLKIRTKIAENPKAFRKVLNDKNFKKYYSGLEESEKHKRLPPELKDAAEDEPLIFNKSFFYGASIKLDNKKDDIKDLIMIHYIAAKPVKDWLKKAME